MWVHARQPALVGYWPSPASMIVGIVGSEEIKFTRRTEAAAKHAILDVLTRYKADGVASGACHLGGIDVWAIAGARHVGIPEDRLFEYPPKHQRWEPNGYKLRNEKIVHRSDALVCITVRELPHTYDGMRFDGCYHCDKITPRPAPHVKSGGCWTMHYAARLGKPTELIII
jgi:hypothetical protein